LAGLFASLAATAPIGAQQRIGRPAAPPVPDCPLAGPVPNGWRLVPAAMARRNSSVRAARYHVGAGDAVTVVVQASTQSSAAAKSVRQIFERDGKPMAPAGDVRFGGRVVSLFAGGTASSGTRAWQLWLPADDDEELHVSVSATAVAGRTVPDDATIRAWLAGARPGSCLDEEPDAGQQAGVAG
jgi:hypothetical protein